jgi:predicted adenine nucleotide alpha hydrolase (AANH) superfamily ATPase
MRIIRVPETTPNHTLVHICCAPDAAFGLQKVIEAFGTATGFFYNPNIWPGTEHEKRLRETEKLGSIIHFDLEAGKRDHDLWYDAIRGLEAEPEKGERCRVCIRLRLEESAKIAARMGIDAFTTVLTVSPHKDAEMVNEAGREMGEKHGLSFIELDLKKEDGFKKSIALSKKYGLYRQKYCGCEYSLRK